MLGSRAVLPLEPWYDDGIASQHVTARRYAIASAVNDLRKVGRRKRPRGFIGLRPWHTIVRSRHADQSMLTTLALALASTLPGAAPQAPPEPWCVPGYHQILPFPLQTRIAHPSIAAACFVPGAVERSSAQALRNHRCVRLQGLTLPGQSSYDLELTRIDDVEPGYISLNGARPGAPGNPTPAAMSLWSGSLRGVVGSRACIAFSAVGVWGWIRTDTRLFHLASFPSAGGWLDYRVMLIDDVDKNRLNGWQCGLRIPEPPTLPPDFGTCLAGLPAAQWQYQCADPGIAQLKLCRAAVETDWQFYSRFGNVQAAEVYARFVLGSVAQALRIDVRVVVELEYLGLWTTPADPWRSQDIPSGQTRGPCCVDVFYEFQHEWGTEDLIAIGPRFNLGPGNGRAPVRVDLYHMISGVQVGCAVGYRGVGTPFGGFSISTGMGAINFSNPNEPRESPFFQVYGAGHEIGHSFGVGHTHNFKIDVNGTPGNLADDVLIDDCARDAGGGPPNCASTGWGRSTLMSYCIGCPPGGLGNIRIAYHPEIARCMRVSVAGLPDVEDVHFVTNLGFGSAPPPATPPVLTYVGQSSGMDMLSFAGSNHPANPNVSLLIVGAAGMYAALPGFTIVPTLDIVLVGVPANVPMHLPLPDGFPNGAMLYFQQVFVVNGTDFYASNGVALEVIR